MFLKIGHRGASAFEIENTLSSFGRAIEVGANAIEMDVRESRDGKLVILHDDNLKRVFKKDIRVNAAALDQLKQLTGNKIPTLEEALRSIGRKVEKILVELKEVGCEERILETIRNERLNERAIVMSFHEQALANIRKSDGKIDTGLIYSRHRNPIDAALRLNADYLVSFYKYTQTKHIVDAHKEGLQVIVWTINTEKEVKDYIAKGVDGIASDRPDIFRKVSRDSSVESS